MASDSDTEFEIEHKEDGGRFFDRLKAVFGIRFISVLSSVFFFQMGLIYSLVYLNQLPFYRDTLGLTETQYQLFFLISWSPLSMKAALAIMSDLFALFGFHKTSYMLVFGALGTGALMGLGLYDVVNSPVMGVAALVFFVMSEITVMDLLCEGAYSKILFEKNVGEGDIISWVWICRVSGQLVGGAIIGFFVDFGHPQQVYFYCVAFSFPTLILLLAGFLGESYVPNWYRKFLVEKFKKQKKLFFLAFVIAAGSIGLVAVSIQGKKVIVAMYSLAVSATLLALAGFLLPPTLAKCNLYIFLQEVCYLRIMGALDYWYTADEACVPGGPHFDMSFYLSVTQIIGCLSGIVAILLFQRYTKSWSFRWAFVFAIFVRVIGSFFDLFMVKRYNLKLGMSDKFTLVFGDAIIMDIAFMLTKMPAVLLTARLVHRGYESTIYSILAGYHDFGKSVSTSMGTALMMHMDIDFTPRPCHIENLPKLIAISHMMLPLVALPFVFILIPNIKMNDVHSFEQIKLQEMHGDHVNVDNVESVFDPDVLVVPDNDPRPNY